jgi:hypothetical protein
MEAEAQGGPAEFDIVGDVEVLVAAEGGVEEEAEGEAPVAPPSRSVISQIGRTEKNVFHLVGPETPHIDVLLVGTAHISYASVEQVQKVHSSQSGLFDVCK